MNIRNSNLLFLRLALFFSILGSGITWTGLGYELATMYNEPALMGVMQIIATIAGLLGPLMVAYFPLRVPTKSILIFSDIISSACYIGLYLLIFSFSYSVNSYGFYTILIFIFISMLIGAIQTIYFEPLYASCITIYNDSKENLTQEFAQLGSYITFGKLLGMGLGPMIFSALHYQALLCNGFTFLISAYLFYFGLKNIKADDQILNKNIEEKQRGQFIFKYNQIINSTFLEGTIASSLIFIVVLFLSIKLISLQPSPIQMSIYWMSATICALVSQITIAKSIELHNFLERLDKKIGFLFCLPILASLFVNDIWSLILCQMVFSFLNPISRNSARAHFFQCYGKRDDATSTYAMREFGTQMIILIFGLTTSFYYSYFVSILGAIFILVLIFLRWYFSKSKISHAQTI